MAKPPYNTAAWRKIRLRILERDDYQCRVRLAGCTRAATCVDHIVPIVEGGRHLDELNLRASCRFCNAARVSRKAQGDPAPLPPSREW